MLDFAQASELLGLHRSNPGPLLEKPMLKMTAIIAGAALALTFTAAHAHDSHGNSYGNNNGGLLGITANVDGLLNVQANVGSRNSSSLLNVDANVGGRNNLATARVDIRDNGNSRGCDFCGHEGGVGHNSGW
jgi:hypothetical protein